MKRVQIEEDMRRILLILSFINKDSVKSYLREYELILKGIMYIVTSVMYGSHMIILGSL